MAKISVLGAGSWGTALSILLYNNGHEVILWSALGEEITTLREKREHVSKLPGVKIPEPIDITTDIEKPAGCRCGNSCSSFALYQKYMQAYGAFCKKRTENCKCCQRRGGKNSSYFKRDY